MDGQIGWMRLIDRLYISQPGKKEIIHRSLLFALFGFSIHVLSDVSVGSV